jgi:hypothetical protein
MVGFSSGTVILGEILLLIYFRLDFHFHRWLRLRQPYLRHFDFWHLDFWSQADFWLQIDCELKDGLEFGVEARLELRTESWVEFRAEGRVEVIDLLGLRQVDDVGVDHGGQLDVVDVLDLWVSVALPEHLLLHPGQVAGHLIQGLSQHLERTAEITLPQDVEFRDDPNVHGSAILIAAAWMRGGEGYLDC